MQATRLWTSGGAVEPAQPARPAGAGASSGWRRRWPRATTPSWTRRRADAATRPRSRCSRPPAGSAPTPALATRATGRRAAVPLRPGAAADDRRRRAGRRAAARTPRARPRRCSRAAIACSRPAGQARRLDASREASPGGSPTLAGRGLRVLAVAPRAALRRSRPPAEREEVERDLTLRSASSRCSTRRGPRWPDAVARCQRGRHHGSS